MPSSETTSVEDFYPRPPRGGRPIGKYVWTDGTQISIHALREEGDPAGVLNLLKPTISIHALREEGDMARWVRLRSPAYFYPRPPRGGRHAKAGDIILGHRFLSTPSARRATSFCSDSTISSRFLSTPSARRATVGQMVSSS